jgi:hypothetical protein
MDLDTDLLDLLWIAREGLEAPLPDDWKPWKTPKSTLASQHWRQRLGPPLRRELPERLVDLAAQGHSAFAKSVPRRSSIVDVAVRQQGYLEKASSGAFSGSTSRFVAAGHYLKYYESSERCGPNESVVLRWSPMAPLWWSVVAMPRRQLEVLPCWASRGTRVVASHALDSDR